MHLCNFVRPPKNFNNYLLTIDNVAMEDLFTIKLMTREWIYQLLNVSTEKG